MGTKYILCFKIINSYDKRSVSFNVRRSFLNQIVNTVDKLLSFWTADSFDYLFVCLFIFIDLILYVYVVSFM